MADDTRTWMSAVVDDKLLSELSIPGTHDSATWPLYTRVADRNFVQHAWSAIKTFFNPVTIIEEVSGVAFAACQTDPLDRQLARGIRCLDARCRHINNSFAMHHGRYYCELNFDDILATCKKFLSDNGREAIVMIVNQEHDTENCTRSFEETFRDYVARYPDLFHLGSEIPELGQVRGKVVVLRRFSATNLGIDLSHDWKDKADSTISTGTASDVFRIQDQYSVSSPVDKWKAVETHLTGATNRKPNEWWINFVSGVGTTNPPASVAAELNPKVQNFEPRGSAVGTVMMDFPDDLTIATILARNFP